MKRYIKSKAMFLKNLNRFLNGEITERELDIYSFNSWESMFLDIQTDSHKKEVIINQLYDLVINLEARLNHVREITDNL